MVGLMKSFLKTYMTIRQGGIKPMLGGSHLFEKF